MQKDVHIYLRHILECIYKIRKYTAGMHEDTFMQNSLIQDAVIRNLEVIGEATKNIDLEFRLAWCLPLLACLALPPALHILTMAGPLRPKPPDTPANTKTKNTVPEIGKARP